jgi:hypothetical protein
MQMASTYRQRGPAVNDEKDTKTRTATSDHAKETQEITNYAQGQNEIHHSRGGYNFDWDARAEGYNCANHASIPQEFKKSHLSHFYITSQLDLVAAPSK